MTEEKNVFEWDNYKKYLRFIEKSDRGGYGFRSRIASAMGVNVAYVSQVLNKSANFSPEQAEALNELLGHSEDEADYFMLLLQIERAGTSKLKSRVSKQAERLKSQQLELKKRVAISSSLTSEDQLKYYSSWHYAAVHMALTIENLQSRENLSEALQMSPSKAQSVLDSLVQMGLAVKEQNRYLTTNNSIFLGRDSDLISKHHTNWRFRAVEFLDRAQSLDIHLSSVLSLNPAEVDTIRSVILGAIDRSHEIAKSSQNEEELHCLNIDFFRLTNKL